MSSLTDQLMNAVIELPSFFCFVCLLKPNVFLNLTDLQLYHDCVSRPRQSLWYEDLLHSCTS